MWLSFLEPHQPFVYPLEDRAQFNPKDFLLPQLGPDDPAHVPICFSAYTPEEKQNIIAAYYTSVSFMDRNVGRALAKLKELGLEDNTLVVYMADHGYSLGQHGRFEKHTCFEPALRVPLTMRCPGKVAKRVVTDFTESVDVPHTVLDVLGVPPFDVRHGQSLRPYLEGRRIARPRQEIFSEYLENEEACIRTAEWKFVQCSGKRARTDGYSIAGDNTPGRYYRLFDLKADPAEFHNVADRHPEVVAKLSATMLARYRATHPDVHQEPEKMAVPDAIDWYLRPRDAQPSPSGTFIFGDPQPRGR
jgi:choline-sulfatase